MSLPPGAVVDSLEVTDTVVRLERIGNLVLVRDLAGTQKRRAGAPDPAPSAVPGAVPGVAPRDPKLRPIDVAISNSETGLLVASFPIPGAKGDGASLVDLTATFSGDLPAVTCRMVVARTGGVG